MPKRPKSICRQAGCGALVEMPGFCPVHKKDQQRKDVERRGTAHERGYNSRWRKAREGFLRKHPLCVHCERERRLTAATIVDHIQPHKLKEALDSGDQVAIERARKLFWDSENNWQSLCKHHHDVKTATEDGAFGRPTKGYGGQNP
ncbi:MAG TPA: HNH endonuclease [Noviherbaspirillum sp.]|nr:HNH endonuclease [Noviherbaspirillum sp.]